MNNRFDRIRAAEKGARISIAVYILLAVAKVGIGYYFASASLTADGFNNTTDVISSVTVLIGLKSARKPADDDHPYGHWKAEPIASLITSFIMLFVGFQVFQSALNRILAGEITPPNQLAAIIALISTFCMFAVYRFNLSLANKVRSNGLKAAAKDNLADALTSLATAVAIFASTYGLGWLDGGMAIVVSLIIFKTGIDIFRESTFSLSDGFHEDELDMYQQDIERLPQVKKISSIKARMYGTNIYVDVTILVDAQISVQEGHDITEKIEQLLYVKYDVMHTDVHVEPDTIQRQFSDEQM